MRKDFYSKKGEYQGKAGSQKHRFNAEYSSEFETKPKKRNKNAKRDKYLPMDELSDLH
jgi:hypothetical protein